VKAEQPEKVRAAVIGVGFAGAAHLRALRLLPQVEVVAVAAQSAESARAAAELYGVPRYYEGHAALLEDSGAQVVHNCTPNDLHTAVTTAALERGLHVLSEKPLGRDASETRSLVDAAAAVDAVTGVCFNYRYYPMVRQLRALLADGTAGRPHLVHGSYLQDWLLEKSDWNWRLASAESGPSRAVADIGSHWLDLVEHVTGDRVERVVAQLGRLHDERLRPDGRPAPVDTEDFANVLLRFASGCHGALTVSQVSAGRKNGLTVEIDTEDASYAWHQEEPDEIWIGRRGRPNELMVRDPRTMSPAAAALTHLPAGHPEGWLDTFVNLFADFYAAVAARRAGVPCESSFASFADAHRIQLIVEAILAGHRLDRPVSLAI